MLDVSSLARIDYIITSRAWPQGWLQSLRGATVAPVPKPLDRAIRAAFPAQPNAMELDYVLRRTIGARVYDLWPEIEAALDGTFEAEDRQAGGGITHRHLAAVDRAVWGLTRLQLGYARTALERGEVPARLRGELQWHLVRWIEWRVGQARAQGRRQRGNQSDWDFIGGDRLFLAALQAAVDTRLVEERGLKVSTRRRRRGG